MAQARADTVSLPLGVPLADPALADRAEQLLSRCAQRDEHALRELYQLVSPQLFGVLMRMLKSRATAEEALRDVMVQIWDRADQSFDYGGRALAWMVAIARYHAIDLLRQREPTAAPDAAASASRPDLATADFAEAMTSERLRKTLDQSFGVLSDDERRCLALAYVGGYSPHQIAGALESPVGSVKSWVRHGLASLEGGPDS